MKNEIIEIVRFKSKDNVLDNQIILAMNSKSPDLKKIKGFISQRLYKSTSNIWHSIYYWESVEDAKNSNIIIQEKDSFKTLMLLIDEESVQIEIMEMLQFTG